MRISTLNLFAVTAAMSALLAACGGSQPPIGATGAMAPAAHTSHIGSWMVPAAKSEDLLYVGGGGYAHGYLHVYSYRSGKLVGNISGLVSPSGECVDTAGDLWVVTNFPDEAIEYAHGGTTPIATLSVPGSNAYGCAVDPTTGDLAVTNTNGVSIFQDAQGTPTTYVDWAVPDYCSYDNKGNLFVVVGHDQLTELPEGSSGFNIIRVDIPGPYSTVQWDGRGLAVGGDAFASYPVKVYQVTISGSRGKAIKTVTLSTKDDRANDAQFWVQGHTVVQPTNRGNEVGIWAYPSGGMPARWIRNFGPIRYDTLAVAISPSQ